MKITDTKEAEIPRIESPPRTPGLHLTDIIHDIAVSSGVDNYSRSGGPTTRMEVGFLWEDTLSMVLKERMPLRWGEIVVDGVAMSPDGVAIEEWVLHEFKCTWKSSRSDPLQNWRWVTQILGYMKGVGTNKCILSVLYINGDYRDSGPQFIQYTITATELEISDNWEMIINHARKRGWVK